MLQKNTKFTISEMKLSHEMDLKNLWNMRIASLPTVATANSQTTFTAYDQVKNNPNPNQPSP